MVNEAALLKMNSRIINPIFFHYLESATGQDKKKLFIDLVQSVNFGSQEQKSQ